MYGGVLMKAHYMEGTNLLSSKEPIYLNKSCEETETHLHAHNFIEIAYVVSGCGTHCIGENKYSVSKGDLFIINYNIPHEFKSLEDTSSPKLWVYNCIFRSEFLDYNLVNCKNFHNITQHFLFKSVFHEESNFNDDIKILHTDSKPIEDLYEKMFMEYKLKEDGYIEILRAYVIELLITIFRIYNKNNVLVEKLESHRQEILNKVIHYMKENYSKQIKLKELSAIAFLSPNYFSRLFKETTTMTISEYMQKIRVEEACHLLKTTNKKVIDIAYEVGYSDIQYFNEIFKNKNGKTPREYKKEIFSCNK